MLIFPLELCITKSHEKLIKIPKSVNPVYRKTLEIVHNLFFKNPTTETLQTMNSENGVHNVTCGKITVP